MTTTDSTKKLRIVYVWDADYPWDVRTEKTCLALTQAGHDVHIVARNRKHSPLTESLPEATVHRMRPWRWAGRKLDAALGFPAFFSPRWRSLIGDTAREVNADLIIVRDLPLCPTAISVGLAQHIPVILDMAEHYPAMIRAIWESGRQKPFDWMTRNPAIVERVEQFCIRNVAHIFTVADEMTERLVLMGCDRSAITCVANTPMPITDRVSVAANTHNPARLQIVYLGLLEVVRGIEELIDAIALLRSQNPRVTLLLIGSGRDEQLFRARAQARGLTPEDVVFAGHVPYMEALGMMAGADIGVLPLHRNPHTDTTVPNKLFDYMNVGLPVITSDTIPSARIVRAEGVGTVFEARNAVDLASKISSLRSVETRSQMSTSGRNSVQARYNWQLDAARLVNSVVRVQRDWG